MSSSWIRCARSLRRWSRLLRRRLRFGIAFASLWSVIVNGGTVNMLLAPLQLLMLIVMSSSISARFHTSKFALLRFIILSNWFTIADKIKVGFDTLQGSNT